MLQHSDDLPQTPWVRRILTAVTGSSEPVALRTQLRRWLRSIPRDLPFLTLLVGLALAGYVLVIHSEGTWFWADDWDLLFLRGTIDSADQGLLAAHNNHWFLAQIFVYRILFEVFGLEYIAYVVTEVLFHLVVCVTLWVLLRRVGAGRWVSVAAALVVAWYGLGATATIFPASMNHVGAALFGLFALHLALPPMLGWRRHIMVVLALVVSIMFGLTGLTMIVLVGLFVLLHHGLLRSLGVGVPPLVVLGVWYATHGRQEGPNNQADSQDPIVFHALPGYVWKGLMDVLGTGSGLAGAGPVLVALLLLVLLRPGAQPPLFVKLAWAGLIAAFVQLGIVAAARYHLGPDGIGVNHYSYLVLVLLVPTIALTGAVLVEYAGRPRWRAGLLVAALFVAYALNSMVLLEKWQDDFSLLSGAAKGLTLGVKKAHQDGQQVLTDRNPDIFNQQQRATYLTDPAIVDSLPAGEPTDEQLLRAQSYFFTAVSEDQIGSFGAADVMATEGLAPFEDEDEDESSEGRRGQDGRQTGDERRSGSTSSYLAPGCHKFLATGGLAVLEIRTEETGTEVVVFSDSTTIATQLLRDDLVGDLVEWKVDGDVAHVATSVPDSTLLASFDGTGVFTVCVS